VLTLRDLIKWANRVKKVILDDNYTDTLEWKRKIGLIGYFTIAEKIQNEVLKKSIFNKLNKNFNLD